MQAKTIIVHILFWCLIMLVGVMTVYPYFNSLKMSFVNRAIFLPVWWLGTYFNWYYLMPRWLKDNRILPYLWYLIITLFGLTILQRLLCIYVFYPRFWWSKIQVIDLAGFSQFFAFIALPIVISIGLFLLKKWYEESYKAKQILAQQQSAELNYLKSQINPHFLFNTLNNLYGLSLEQSPKVPQLILKLSDILSFSLYESKAKTIDIQKEIRLIHDFIDLEKERYSDRIKVIFNNSIAPNQSIHIAPLLLIPLVENAFKHGVKESTDALPISIDLFIKKEILHFNIINAIPSNQLPVDSKHKGLGLRNLKRRLELSYPQRYELDTSIQGETFRAQLKINLNENL